MEEKIFACIKGRDILRKGGVVQNRGWEDGANPQ